MAIIYRKTAKGVAEIETRAHRLTPRMRSTLILVDGRRSDAELGAMILQQATETLHALAGQGFIEVLTVAAAAVAPASPPRAPATPWQVPPAAAATSAAAAAPAGPDLAARKRVAVRALTDLLGPAAESVAMRIERARSLDELRTALSSAVQTVGMVRGRQAGEAFAARFGDL